MLAEVLNSGCSSACFSTISALLAQLAIIGIAIALTLRLITPEDALKKIMSVVAVVVLVECFVAMVRALWLGLAGWQQALVLLIGILCVVIAVRKVFA